MRRILKGGLLATMLLALFLVGFTDFLEPAAPPGPGPAPDAALEAALDRAVPLPTLPPADAPLPDSLPALEREAVQIREEIAQINQAMDRMLDGVLSVLRPYGEARTADDAATRRLETLSAQRRQSLDRLSRIEMRRAEIEAGAAVPATAAAMPPEPATGIPGGTQPFQTVTVVPTLPGFSATEETAAPRGVRPEAGPGEAAPTVASPVEPPLAGTATEGRASTGASGGPPRAASEPDEPATAPAMQALPISPPTAPVERVAKPVPRPMRAEPASLRSATANPARCRSIILRGQLGEGLSFADRSFLRGHCQG